MSAGHLAAEATLRALAAREGWLLDSPQTPTLASWRFDAGDSDIEVRVDGLDAVIAVDGIAVTVDLTGCESVEDAAMRIEAESQLIAG